MKVRGQTVCTAEERVARLSIPAAHVGLLDLARRYADKMESGNERD